MTKKTNTFTSVTAKDLGISASDKRLFPITFSTCVRVLHQNWRQGTVKVKGRSDVSKTNKKPWKQKGTGRARAGSARSPLWRGGGITFGPQPRVKTLSVTKKTKQKVLQGLFAEYIQNGKIGYIDWENTLEKPKTSSLYNAIKDAQLSDKKVVLFVDINDYMTISSAANIPSISALSFDQSNAVDLSSGDYWVFLKKDLDQFKKMVLQWH